MKNERKTRTIYLTIRVDYDCPIEMSNEESSHVASNLAINPNNVSMVDGVKLDNVEVCGVNDEEI